MTTIFTENGGHIEIHKPKKAKKKSKGPIDIRGNAKDDVDYYWEGRSVVVSNLSNQYITVKVAYGSLFATCGVSKTREIRPGRDAKYKLPQNSVGVCYIDARYGRKNKDGDDFVSEPTKSATGNPVPDSYWHYEVDKTGEDWIFSFSTPPALRKVRIWTESFAYLEMYMEYGDTVVVLDGQWMQGQLDDGTWSLLTDVDRR